MTATELRALILASGLTNSEFARRLGLAPRSMRRMLSGETPILPRTEAAIRRMLGVGDATPDAWPRDEWIVGEGPPPTRREYLIHTAAPRFIARVVAMDTLTDQPEPDEEPADTMTGVTYAAGDSLICEITWIDPPPSDPTALLTLIDRAADQLGWDA
jgi:transcriptional regulator with XRE-family HTH domain